jgi:5-methylcytosine-specific restriction endonuclease McrA
MNYYEQLCTNEWRRKREEILARDKRKCQHCYNASIVRDNHIGIFKKWAKKPAIFSFTENKILFRIQPVNIRGGDFICFYTRPHKTSIVVGITKEHWAPKQRTIPLEVVLDEDQKGGNWYDAPSRADLLERINRLEWLYVWNIHIHHKYYQQGLMAWEYPDSALVTLCWQCHEQLHENEEIEIRDTSGKTIRHELPCKRCMGAGRLPEFSHVQGGICFACWGRRY